jgi:hypothetical protein
VAEIKQPKRRPKDFNYTNVTDLAITDPENEGKVLDREYPKHVHKFDEELNELVYESVGNPSEEAAAKRRGFGSAQDAHAAYKAANEVKAPAPKKGAKVSASSAAPAKAVRKRAAKPRNPKPKPVAAAAAKG